MREVRKHVGQMLTIGFEGPRPTPFVRQFLEKEDGGGTILFRRNLGSAEEILELNLELRSLAADNIPYAMIDQEGGPVMRLRQVSTQIPSMGRVGEFGTLRDARKAGEILGREVRALGFNVNCAPVLDVNSNPDNPIIGERSFSSDPHEVGKRGEAFIRGLQAEGVLACGKHFPGHGDTSVDSHLELPVSHHDEKRLEVMELVPFRHVLRTAPPALIMTAHILLPALDPDRPATLSEKIIPILLREKLGYRGVVVTDDLEMKAIDDRYAMEEVIRFGLRADIDVFLICRMEDKQRLALETLKKLVVDGEVSSARIERSLRRINRTKTALATTPAPLAEDLSAALLQDASVEWARKFESA